MSMLDFTINLKKKFPNGKFSVGRIRPTHGMERFNFDNFSWYCTTKAFL